MLLYAMGSARPPVRDSSTWHFGWQELIDGAPDGGAARGFLLLATAAPLNGYERAV